MEFLAITIFWIGGSILIGLIGKNREIGFLPVFIISLILSPILGIIVALCSRRKYSFRRLVENQESMFKQQYLHHQNSVQKRADTGSVADELLKLKQLLDAEAIDQQEYDDQKRRLLKK